MIVDFNTRKEITAQEAGDKCSLNCVSIVLDRCSRCNLCGRVTNEDLVKELKRKGELG